MPLTNVLPATARPSSGRRHARGSGQALVEFTLIVPILLTILLGVADFARFFAAGIAVESAARTSAEVVAQEYVRAEPGTAVSASSGDAYYVPLHALAAATVCNELKTLPNSGFDASTGVCAGIPVQVCIHDGSDTQCSVEPNSTAIPPGCSTMASGWLNNTQPVTGETSRRVEVRTCYRFSTILGVSGIPGLSSVLPVLNGNFYIERDRSFTVADY